MQTLGGRSCPLCGGALERGRCAACAVRVPSSNPGSRAASSSGPARIPSLRAAEADARARSPSLRAAASSAPARAASRPAGATREPLDLPSLPELPDLPTLDPGGLPMLGNDALLTPEQAAMATTLAASWAGGALLVYGKKPHELDRLIRGVLDDAGKEPQEPPRFDAAELSARAGYGEPPDGRIAAVFYAVRVFRRKRELLAELPSVQRAADEARSAGRDALASLGDAIFARRAEAARGSLLPRVEQAARAFAALEERKRDAAALDAEAQAELAVHDQAIAEAERKAEPYRKRVAELSQKVAEAKRDVERAIALHKRTVIEIRAAQGAAQPDAKRIERAQAEQAVREAEVNAAQAALAAAEAELGAARADLQEKEAAVTARRAARAAASETYAQRAAEAQAETARASEQSRDALCELARRALLDNLAPKAPAEAAIQALEAARSAAEQQALLGAAVDAYDHDGFRSGVTTAAAAAALLVLLGWLLV